MFNGLNNRLANVPTITGLSTVTADQVITDDLIIDGIDVGTAIADLQQITTGITYDSGTDTTTIANNVTLTPGKTITADNFTGLASNATQVQVTNNNLAQTYYLTYAPAGTLGSGQRSLLFDNSAPNPLSYFPSTGTITASNFTGLASNATTSANIALTGDDTSGSYFIPFSKTTSATINALFIDNTTTPLSYNPNSSTLSATNFTAGTNVTTPNILSLTSITPSNARSILFNGTPFGNFGNTSSIVMGLNAGSSGTMPNNCFCFGSGSGQNLTTGIPFSGVQNLFIGANSGNQCTSGRNNCFIGPSAGRKTTTGSYNCQIGSQSQSFPDENFTGFYNTTIGAECHILVDGLSYSTAIGAGVVASTSNTVRIGRNVDNTIFDGTVTLNNNLILDSVGYTLSPTELSYLDGVSSNIQTQFSGKVNNTGDETIAGIKTFSSVPICSTNATTSTQLTNKAYVDAAISAATPANMVTTNTTQSITGAKTFDGVTTTFQTNGSTATSTLNITDTGTSNRIAFFPRGGAGLNSVAVVNDSMITAFSSEIDTGRLSIVPHSSTSCGIRLTNNTALIGAGGTSVTPTASILFSGTNVGVRGTLTLNTDVTLSQLNQTFSIRNNNLVNTTITTTGLIPAGGLNKIALTDGSNPTSAQILNTIVTGTNIPNQTDTYYVSAHSYNFSIQITTLGIPAGQISSINTLAIGTFITSNIGTNFVAGTYITGVAPGIDLYYISQNALNTTLFKVNHTGSLITTNLTLSAPTTANTVLFKNQGVFQFLTNNASGNQIMPLSINSTEMYLNVAMVANSLAIFNGIASFNGTASLNGNVNIAQNNISLGTGSDIINIGSGAGNTSNLILGQTNAKSVVFTTGGNTVIGRNAGLNMTAAASDNTYIGSSPATNATSSIQNVCVGSGAGVGITSGSGGNVFVGYLSGFRNGVNGTGANNVCIGKSAGTGITSTSNNNTLIGTQSGDAITSGAGNTICGFDSGGGILTGQNNTIIGSLAGNNISAGSNGNICIGRDSVVPNAAGSNQISIGRVNETMYIQGGFNWRVGAQITNSTNGNLSAVVLAQFYTVAMSAASQTITLPNPASVAYIGARVLFKRKTNTTAFSLTQAAGFLNYGNITIQPSPYSVPNTIFQVDLISDGTNWCVVSQR